MFVKYTSRELNIIGRISKATYNSLIVLLKVVIRAFASTQREIQL